MARQDGGGDNKDNTAAAVASDPESSSSSSEDWIKMWCKKEDFAWMEFVEDDEGDKENAVALSGVTKVDANPGGILGGAWMPGS